jgi:hypothetical protein
MAQMLHSGPMLCSMQSMVEVVLIFSQLKPIHLNDSANVTSNFGWHIAMWIKYPFVGPV